MSGTGGTRRVLGPSRRINCVWEDMGREAGGRGAVIDIRSHGGCEQRFSRQDQIARLFNGIKGRQRGILEFICANERIIH